LEVHTAQRRGLDPVAKLLGPDVADQVCRAIGAAILMTVEAGHAEARVLAAAICG